MGFLNMAKPINKKKKRRKIAKHVLQAREKKKAELVDAEVEPDLAPTSSAEATADKTGSADQAAAVGVVRKGKRKKQKETHVKEPSEAAKYLLDWKASKEGNGTWKFNSNTQS